MQRLTLSTDLIIELLQKDLSVREIETLEEALNHDENFSTAIAMFINEKTVKFHMSNTGYKLEKVKSASFMRWFFRKYFTRIEILHGPVDKERIREIKCSLDKVPVTSSHQRTILGLDNQQKFELLHKALIETKGNVRRATKIAEISFQTAYHWVDRFGMNLKKYRDPVTRNELLKIEQDKKKDPETGLELPIGQSLKNS